MPLRPNMCHPRKRRHAWPRLLHDLMAGPLCTMGRPGAGGALLVLVVSVLCGCASFRPQPLEMVGFRERAATREDGQVRVTAAVPSPAESAALFGVEVAAKGIQPVWLRIENHDDVDYFFLPISLDPHYFSAQEAAWKSRFFLGGAANEALADQAVRLTPWRYDGKEVWVGQISRDIGVRWSSKTFVTHKIDPHVDAARDYLLTDLFFSGRLAAYDYLAGVGAATRTTPRFTYTGDPYHTDGRRVVLVVSTQEVPWHALVDIDWEDVKPQPP